MIATNDLHHLQQGVTGSPHNYEPPGEFDHRGRPVRLNLTGDVAKATLPGANNEAWRRKNPATAVARRYTNAHDPEMGWERQSGRAARAYWDGDRNHLRRLFQSGGLPSGVAMGGLGLLGGYGLGTVVDNSLNLPFKTRPAVSALVAALMASAGVGMSKTVRGQMSKQAMFTPKGLLRHAVASDPALSFSEKGPLMAAVNDVSYMQAQQMSRLLRTGGGAGLGTLVAKGLLRAGQGGQIAGALIGGVVGNRLSQERRNFRVGHQTLMPGRDAVGTPYWRV